MRIAGRHCAAPAEAAMRVRKSARFAVTGSKTNVTRMRKADVLKAMRHVGGKSDYVWDGKSEDDRPATAEELVGAVAADRRKRGRPAGSG